MPFSLEEKEDLVDLVTHPGFSAILKFLEERKAVIEMDVLRYNLESGDEKGLFLAKARSEGAAKLLTAIKRELETLRPSSKKKQAKDRVAT